MPSGRSDRHDGGMTTNLVQAAPPAYLRWLGEEVRDWQQSGLVDQQQADAILARYRPERRLSLARLLLTLGAVFVGFGILWLVAANLDQLPPPLRFGAVVVLWIGLTVGAEVLAGRRAHGGHVSSPVVGAVRILGSLAFGAVVFQAAQSLQVPAYEPVLVGCWAFGALLHAYAVRGMGPLVIALAAGSGWLIWQIAWEDPSALGIVLAFLALGVGAVSVASLHGRAWTEFAPAWRETGVLWLLIGLFAAALPWLDADDVEWTPTLVAALGVALTLAVAAVVVAPGQARLEPLAAVGASALAVLLVLWDAGGDVDRVGAEDWAHAIVAVAAYVALAAGVAVLGVLRDSPRLTALATTAIVLFTTVQSFAVFAQVIQGAWLFVFLGLVLLGTGYAADRGRRQLAASLEGELA